MLSEHKELLCQGHFLFESYLKVFPVSVCLDTFLFLFLFIF